MENTPVIDCSSTWVSTLFSKEKFFSLIFITSLPRGVDSMALRTVLGETTALEWFSKSLSLITADQTIIHEEANTNYFQENTSRD